MVTSVARVPSRGGGGVAAEEEEALPEGWSWAVDERFNAAYYFHTASGRTQWERPQE